MSAINWDGFCTEKEGQTWNSFLFFTEHDGASILNMFGAGEQKQLKSNQHEGWTFYSSKYTSGGHGIMPGSVSRKSWDV